MALSKRFFRAGSRARALACCIALLALVGPAAAATTEEIVQLPSASGAVQPYLLSRDDARPVGIVAVLFTGGAGAVGLLSRGIPEPGDNFLVRSRELFIAQGIATAVVDSPSDERTLSDAFRMSARHAQDVAAVVADLHARWPQARIFLVGTSRGTVSAAYTGAALGGAVAGVALTSSVFNSSRGGAGLAHFDFASIAAPLLFVHHADDACPVTPYRAAEALSARYPLITVRGGAPARSGPCEPYSAHGYFGVEAPTVAALSQWMSNRDYPRRIP